MEITTQRGAGPLRCDIKIGEHTLISDGPVSVGGENRGPEPHDLLAAALAACTSITVTMYAQRKSMDLQDIHVSVTHEHKGASYELHRRIEYFGNLTPEDKARLTDIANKCPVHKTLIGEITIITESV